MMTIKWFLYGRKNLKNQLDKCTSKQEVANFKRNFALVYSKSCSAFLINQAMKMFDKKIRSFSIEGV